MLKKAIIYKYVEKRMIRFKLILELEKRNLEMI